MEEYQNVLADPARGERFKMGFANEQTPFKALGVKKHATTQKKYKKSYLTRSPASLAS